MVHLSNLRHAVSGNEVFTEGRKRACLQMLTYLSHQAHVKVEVVNSHQAHSKNFLDVQQMADIGFREICAGITGASLLQRREVGLEPSGLCLDQAG